MTCKGLSQREVQLRQKKLRAIKKAIQKARKEAKVAASAQRLQDQLPPEAASRLTIAESKAFKAVAWMFPNLRLEASPFVTSVLVAENLVSQRLPRLKNVKGLASNAAAESYTKAVRGLWLDVKVRTDELFMQMKAAGGTMTKEEFLYGITSAMRRGDKSSDSFIQQAIGQRRAFFDEIKNEATALGVPGFSDDLDISKFADSYVPRVLDQAAVREGATNRHGERLQDMLRRVFEANGIKNPDEVAEIVQSKMMGDSVGRSADDYMFSQGVFQRGKAGPLRKRSLLVRDEELEPFLINDIEVLSEYYARSTGGDIAILRAGGGDVEGTNFLVQLEKEAAAKIRAADTQQEADILRRRLRKDRTDIEMLVARIRHTHLNPEDFVSRAANNYRKVSAILRLPNIAIASIPDIARPIMVLGFARTFNAGWSPVLRNFKAAGMSQRQLLAMGTAIDNEVNHLFTQLTLTGRPATPRFLDKSLDQFTRITGIRQWNTSMKAIAGRVALADMSEAIRRSAAGDLPQDQITRLAALGVGQDAAKRMAQQIDEFSETVDGVMLPNTRNWTDSEARRLYEQAIVKQVDAIIVTPGVGDLPNFMNNDVLKAFVQFRSFGFASVQKTVLPALAGQDQSVIMGLMGLVALGMLGDQVRRLASGDDREFEPLERIARGVERSGALGVFSDWTQSFDVFSGGLLSSLVARDDPRVSRGSPGSRFAQRVGGLPFQDVRDAVNASHGLVTGITGGDVTRAQIRAARKFIPLQQWWVTRRILFDQIQEAAEEQLGLPPEPVR